MVEIGAGAEQIVQAHLTRRLIALELADVDVPPPLDFEPSSGSPTLFFRVLGAGEDALRVELWGYGQPHGALRITNVGGTSQLRARRVALAAAALARRLRSRRLAEARRAASGPDGPVGGGRGDAPLAGRFAFSPGAAVALVGPGDMTLAGPTLGASVRFASGVRLALGGAWMVGTAHGASDDAGGRWAEVNLAPSAALALGGRWQLDVGAVLAASAVHLTAVRAVDDVRGLGDTWSARAALRPALEGALGGQLGFFVAPEAGVVLRRVVATSDDGRRSRLGGVWLGLGAGLVLDPGASAP